MNNCRESCPWLLRCLAKFDSDPITVRFCGNCHKIRGVDSSSALLGYQGNLESKTAYDVLCKIYTIADIEQGVPRLGGTPVPMTTGLAKLAQVALDTCPRAEIIVLDFTCEDCLSGVLQDLVPKNLYHKNGEIK